MPNRCIPFLFALLLCFSCGEDPIPKPKALLRLDYPRSRYKEVRTDKFSFEGNARAKAKMDGTHSMTLDYPGMKGAIFISYKPVEGNLQKLLADAQKLSYEHVIKADGIAANEYLNPDEQVYGMFYEVSGDAASQAQFYATDSIGHFVTGSLYFYAKPNYDSIYPAAAHLRKDIRRIMETLRWQE